VVSALFREETTGKRATVAAIHWMDAALDPNPRKDALLIEHREPGFIGNGSKEVDPRMLACGTPIDTYHGGTRLDTCSDISYNAESSNFRQMVTEGNLAHVLQKLPNRATYFTWICRARSYRCLLTSVQRCAQERNLYRRIRRDGYSIKFSLVRRIIGSFEINLNESHNLLPA